MTHLLSSTNKCAIKRVRNTSGSYDRVEQFRGQTNKPIRK